ncbi:MAG: pyruvate kinase [Planctomycetes bacterium]|nr:pyruvate kinase [Planctomycetota bacterium]
MEPDRLAALAVTLDELHARLLAAERDAAPRLAPIHPSYQASARNLVHYLQLRTHDLRPLQQHLVELGLSSLGRCEPNVVAALEAVTRAVKRLAGAPDADPAATPAALVTSPSDAQRPSFADGPRLLARHTEELLGPARPERSVRILVTLPSEAADDPALVRDWITRGMDCARINCAHDDATKWGRMVDHVRRAEAATGRRCRILMDLAGPKLRTGPIEPGPAVARVRPQRDPLGRVTRPARVWLHAGSATPSDADGVLPVEARWLAKLRIGDVVETVDARGRARELAIVAVGREGAFAQLDRTAYFVPGGELQVRGRDGATAIGPLPPREGELRLRRGDPLLLPRALEPGRPAERDAAGALLFPARIGCTLPQVFDFVQAGESIWFDDGRIGGVVRRVEHEVLHVEITRAGPDGETLRADKGINLPDSALDLPALTEKDVADLEFVARHADGVALSFVQRPADVQELEERLRALDRPDLGIVLKIETKRAFEQLPHLLLATMQSPRDGVMIARGDLAVECGFERLAEVQEEILWICEAAHVPVIWATQVLETLAKSGRPSRAEITDAAMGERAECVMLNKGRHLAAALDTLSDILARMQAHQWKKRAMLRPLRLARGF